MPGETRARLPGLDLLRALAICLVVVFHHPDHGPGPLRAVGRFGWIGVDLFFVLSGYLIGNQLLGPIARKEALCVRHFYLRRLFRTLPNYLVILTLYFTVPVFREKPDLPRLWKFLTFTQNIRLYFSAFSHAWSLCVEEQFYFALPPLLLLCARYGSFRKGGAALGIAVLGGVALRAYLALLCPQEYSALIYYPTWSRLDGLILGVALSALRQFRSAAWERLLRHGNSALVAGSLCVVLVLAVCEPGKSLAGSALGFPLLALGFASLVLSAVSPTSYLGRLRVPGASTIAILAYALYLSHKAITHLVLLAAERLELRTYGPLVFGLSAGASLLFATLLHLAIERPFLLWRERWPIVARASNPLQGPIEVFS